MENLYKEDIIRKIIKNKLYGENFLNLCYSYERNKLQITNYKYLQRFIKSFGKLAKENLINNRVRSRNNSKEKGVLNKINFLNCIPSKTEEIHDVNSDINNLIQSFQNLKISQIKTEKKQNKNCKFLKFNSK